MSVRAFDNTIFNFKQNVSENQRQNNVSKQKSLVKVSPAIIAERKKQRTRAIITLSIIPTFLAALYLAPKIKGHFKKLIEEKMNNKLLDSEINELGEALNKKITSVKQNINEVQNKESYISSNKIKNTEKSKQELSRQIENERKLLEKEKLERLKREEERLKKERLIDNSIIHDDIWYNKQSGSNNPFNKDNNKTLFDDIMDHTDNDSHFGGLMPMTLQDMMIFLIFSS